MSSPSLLRKTFSKRRSSLARLHAAEEEKDDKAQSDLIFAANWAWLKTVHLKKLLNLSLDEFPVVMKDERLHLGSIGLYNPRLHSFVATAFVEGLFKPAMPWDLFHLVKHDYRIASKFVPSGCTLLEEVKVSKHDSVANLYQGVSQAMAKRLWKDMTFQLNTSHLQKVELEEAQVRMEPSSAAQESRCVEAVVTGLWVGSGTLEVGRKPPRTRGVSFTEAESDSDIDFELGPMRWKRFTKDDLVPIVKLKVICSSNEKSTRLIPTTTMFGTEVHTGDDSHILAWLCAWVSCFDSDKVDHLLRHSTKEQVVSALDTLARRDLDEVAFVLKALAMNYDKY